MFNMTEILNEVTKGNPTDSEMYQASQRLVPYWEKIRKAFTLQFAEEMSQANQDLCQLKCQESFTCGLWLGLRLGQFTEQGPGGGVGDL